MRIAIDSNDLPAEKRLDTWRGMLCDTYIGLDGEFPAAFRSVVEGHAVGHHTLTRVTSTRHTVRRSPTLIKRDGLELVFFGFLLAGRVLTIQDDREAVLKRDTVVINDSSRPFVTHVEESADVIWLSVPKKTMTERLHGLEDKVAITLRPGRPLAPIATKLMAGFDAALARDLPAPDVERLTTRLLDVMALTILGGALPSGHRPEKSWPIQ